MADGDECSHRHKILDHAASGRWSPPGFAYSRLPGHLPRPAGLSTGRPGNGLGGPAFRNKLSRCELESINPGRQISCPRRTVQVQSRSAAAKLDFNSFFYSIKLRKCPTVSAETRESPTVSAVFMFVLMSCFAEISHQKAEMKRQNRNEV